MGKFQGALLLAARSLLAGCGGKTVPTGELTGPDVHTLQKKSKDGSSVRFQYRLKQRTAGRYAVRGNALFQEVGRIKQAQVKLCLANGNEAAAAIPLRVRVTPADKKVHFCQEFKVEVPFDSVDFSWRLKYRY